MSDSAPAGPDYIGAANAQGKQNIKAAVQEGMINNANVYNPYGSQQTTWKNTGTAKNPMWIPTTTQTLSQDQQTIMDQGEANQIQNLGTANVIGGQVANSLANPLTFDGMHEANAGTLQGYDTRPIADTAGRRDDVINAMMSRVSGDIKGARDAKNAELVAAGLRPGMTAYDAAMGALDRQETDARQQAILAGGQEASRDLSSTLEARKFGQTATQLNNQNVSQQYELDNAQRQRDIAEALQLRQNPLNEMAALTGGTGVNNPFAGNLGFNSGMNVAPVDIYGATVQQGNAQMNQANANQANINNYINAGAGLLGTIGSMDTNAGRGTQG